MLRAAFMSCLCVVVTVPRPQCLPAAVVDGGGNGGVESFQGSPGPLILICGVGGGGTPSVLSRARLHVRSGSRLSPYEVKSS